MDHPGPRASANGRAAPGAGRVAARCIASSPPGVPEAQLERYASVLAPLDANRYIGHAAPAAAFLFQAARYDAFTPRAAVRSYYDSAAGAKSLEWYDASEELMDPAALAARDRWLEKQLSLHQVLPLLEQQLTAGTKGQ
jgi:hypothetical protein